MSASDFFKGSFIEFDTISRLDVIEFQKTFQRKKYFLIFNHIHLYIKRFSHLH